MNLINAIFTKIKSISWHRYSVLLIFFVGTVCYAATSEESMMGKIIEFMNIVFVIMTALLTPAVILAWWLLTPDWTMGDFFGLRPYFLNVWILVSNLVYIAFAMILLFLAVMQIFGGENAEYTFKKKLPQFLVGILMVPFTWLIVSWTLSFANQATAAVLAIPMGAIAELESSDTSGKRGIFHEKVIPTKIDIFAVDWEGGIDCTTDSVDANDKRCISAAEFVKNNPSWPFFIMMIYAYDIFRIQSTDLVDIDTAKCTGENSSQEVKNCIKSLTDVVISFGTGLIVTFFFWVLTIALCWVLLMRAFKLWIYVMFSPLFGLAFFSGKGWWEALHSDGGWDHGSGGMSQVGFVQFFKLAMVPVMVSAVLSFWLLFVGVINETFSPGNLQKESSSNSFCTPFEGYMVRYCITPNGEAAQWAISQLIIGTTKDNKNDEYTITFDFWNKFSWFLSNKSASIIKAGGEGIVDSIQSIFAHVILTLISLVIIWMGIKTAVSHDKITEAAFAPFAKLGDSVWHFVQHIPSYIPTPHPSFAALSPAFAGKLAERMRTNVDETVEASTARSMADILGDTETRKSSQLADSINNSDGLDRFINQLASTKRGVRDSNTILKDIKTALDKIPSSLNLQGAELTAFNALNTQLQGASSREEQARILRDPSNAVHIKALESNQKVTALFEQIQSSEPTASSASSSSNELTESEKFKWQTIWSDGNIDISWSLSDTRKKAIKDAFWDENKIKAMSKDEIKTKLAWLWFDKAELDKINTEDQAEKAAISLLKKT
jgi:hypothetical protein